MKYTKTQLPTIFVAILVFLSASIGASAQIKHGDLSLLKGKTKVFIPPYGKTEIKEIVDAVKQYPGLKLVTKKEDADFSLLTNVSEVSGSKLSLNGRMVGPDNVDTDMYSTASAADRPWTTTRIVRLGAYFTDNTGLSIQVWSKEWTDLITSPSVSTSFSDPRESAWKRLQLLQPSSVAARNLIRWFLADLKKKTK